MPYYLINEQTPADILTALSRFGVCIPLPACESLPVPVSRHPDMLIAHIADTYFVHREYEAGQEILSRLGVPFRISHAPLGKEYPKDVPLNCFSIGNFLFENSKTVSPDILAFADEKSMTLLPVKQGYTKCSAAVAGGAVVSADRGIIRAAQSAGLPALLIPPHPIGIEAYDTGFLGGASALLDEHTLAFFGKIEAHPSYEAIRAFFSTRDVEIISLSEKSLFDYGGAIIIED